MPKNARRGPIKNVDTLTNPKVSFDCQRRILACGPNMSHVKYFFKNEHNGLIIISSLFI